MSSREIIIPIEENSSQIYSSVIDAFRQITSEISEMIDFKLIPLLGENWQNNLAVERQSRVNLKDPEFIFKEPLRNTSSPVRLCLPREKNFYDLLDSAWKLRNKWFHNEVTGTSKEALEVFNNLLKIANELNLKLEDSLKIAKSRIEEISNGKTFKDDNQDNKISFKIEEMENQLIALANEASQAQVQLLEAEKRESELDTEIINIQKIVNDRDIMVKQSAEQINSMNETIKTLRENLLLAQFERENAIQIAEDAKKYSKELNEIISNINLSKKADEIKSNIEIPIPGQKWPYQRGQYKLTLSPRFKELYIPKTATLLSELIGEKALQIAQDWLNIRESGGRVFMDKSGYSTTYSGDDLIYLGKFENDSLNIILKYLKN